MKKTRFFIATLLVVAAASVAVVSCKKEANDTLLNNTSSQVKTFAPPQVDDMNAYLKGFKQKMQNVTREGDETLSLEEAAWHLSSVANYDFAKVNVEFTDLIYDTLYYQVSVTNGQITMNDLNTVYENIASDIVDYYQNLDLDKKHFRYIGASISEDGTITLGLIISYVWFDHSWYFDSFYMDTVCDYYFSEDSIYVWNGLGATELERLLNLLEGRDYIMPGESSHSRLYYVYSTEILFDFRHYHDPYGSNYCNDSRIYSVEDDTYAVPVMTIEDMCYCLDSYLGLPFEYVNSHYMMGNQRPVHWHVEGHSGIFGTNHWPTYYHDVYVIFAQVIGSNDNPIL